MLTRNMMGAEDTALAFCRAWFEQRDARAAGAFLSRDVVFADGGEQGIVCGGEEMSAEDLIMEIEADGCEGYSELLPIMLMLSEDPVIRRSAKRLFLHFYSREYDKSGSDGVLKLVADVLKDERDKWTAHKAGLNKKRPDMPGEICV